MTANDIPTKTFGSLLNFVLAMTLYPDVMRKAQGELDAVVGRDRLPTFSDKDNLPYLRAIIKETLRWRPVGPLGMFLSYPMGGRISPFFQAVPRRVTEVISIDCPPLGLMVMICRMTGMKVT